MIRTFSLSPTIFWSKPRASGDDPFKVFNWLTGET